MRRPRRSAASWVATGAAAAVFVLGLGCTQQVTRPALYVSIRLKPGQSAVIPGTELEIGFIRVVNDSRCPEDVVCVWEGDALVALWARQLGRGGRETLNAHIRGMTRLDSTSAAVGFRGYRIQALGLDPYPRAGVPIDTTAYQVLLRVTRR